MIGCQAFSKSSFEVVDSCWPRNDRICVTLLSLKYAGRVTLGAGEDVTFTVCASLVMLSPTGAKKQSPDAWKHHYFLFLCIFIFVVFSSLCGWTMTRCTMHFPTGCFLQLTQPRCSSKCRMRTTTHPSSPGSSTSAAWPKTPRSSALCSR